MPPSPTRTRWRLLAALLSLSVVAAACGGDDSGGGDDATPAGATDEADTLRLGYFPNLTHASALVGIEGGVFQEALGDVTLEATSFGAGPEAVEALLSGSIDATFIGPNPAINAYAQTDGAAVRIVAGATSGGAFLVVRPEIDSLEDLEGHKVASPQLGNTQDVALRNWLAEGGLETTPDGGGDVQVIPQENAQTLDTYVAGEIDGAWVPEPWATRLIEEGGAEVLVDERELWPDGQWVTTHLMVSTEFLEENPGVIRSLIEGLVEANEMMNDDPEAAQALVNDGIEAITDKRLPDEILASAFGNMEFTTDPIADSLRQMAENAQAVGLLDPVELDGIYALDLLNRVLAERGEDEVSP